MTLVVLDVNVLVSALISQSGSAPDLVVRAAIEGEFEFVLSPKLIAELQDVLGRPRLVEAVASGRGDALVAAVRSAAMLLSDPEDPERVSPDPDDDYLIALARAARADFLVSGDAHLTNLVDPDPPVLTPRELVDRLGL